VWGGGAGRRRRTGLPCGCNGGDGGAAACVRSPPEGDVPTDTGDCVRESLGRKQADVRFRLFAAIFRHRSASPTASQLGRWPRPGSRCARGPFPAGPTAGRAAGGAARPPGRLDPESPAGSSCIPPNPAASPRRPMAVVRPRAPAATGAGRRAPGRRRRVRRLTLGRKATAASHMCRGGELRCALPASDARPAALGAAPAGTRRRAPGGLCISNPPARQRRRRQKHFTVVPRATPRFALRGGPSQRRSV
jgi:hypothetical protein